MNIRNFSVVGLVGLAIVACSGTAMDSAEDVGEKSEALTSLTAPAVRLFDGVDDRVTIPNNASQQFGTGDFTLEASVTLSSATSRGYEPILSSRTSGTSGFLFVVYGNTLLLQLSGVPNYQSSVIPNINDGKAHHLAVTRAGTTVQFYVDGKLYGSVSTARSASSTGPIYIGYDNYDRRSLGGSFGQVRLWNVARSTEQLADAAAGKQPSDSTPGLVGSYAPNSALSQMVVDQSPLHNPGYLGSVAKNWDKQDPSWANKVTLELSEATATPVPASGATFKTAAANPDLAICGALTVNGVFDTVQASNYSSLEEATYHYFCDNEQKNLKLAVDFAGKLTIPIEGVPVELEADNKTSLAWQKVKSHCEAGASSMSHVEANSLLTSTASPVLVKAFDDCIDKIVGSSSPAVLQGTQSVSTDEATVVFNLIAKQLVNGQPDTLVVDYYVTGATCTGALTQTNTVVPSAQPVSAICTRDGSSPISFAVVTTQGSYLFNVGGSGVTGSAWVTGAAKLVTETKAQKCQDLTTGPRTCIFCSPSSVSGSFNVDYPYVKFRNASLTKVSGDTTSESFGLSNGDTTVWGSYKRKGGHSANERLCAEQFRTDTSYVDYQTPQVNVYGTKNFEVIVSNTYEGKALHVHTTTNDVLVQALDAASYAPPFNLVTKVADPNKTTYLVSIDD